MLKILSLILSCALLSVPALAENAKKLGKTGDWESFTYSEKGGKVCYAASQPKRTANNVKGRGDVYVTITDRSSDKSTGVFSVTEGFPLRKDGAFELDISGAKFELYASGNTAWAHNDKAVLNAMLKNKTMVVHGQPAKGESVADTYSLDGFSAAWAAMGKACGMH